MIEAQRSNNFCRHVTFQISKHSPVPSLYMGWHSLLPALGFVQAEQIRLDPGFQLPKIDNFLSFRKLELYSSMYTHSAEVRDDALCSLPSSSLVLELKCTACSWNSVFIRSSPRYTLCANSRSVWGCVGCLRVCMYLKDRISWKLVCGI